MERRKGRRKIIFDSCNDNRIYRYRGRINRDMSNHKRTETGSLYLQCGYYCVS